MRYPIYNWRHMKPTIKKRIISASVLESTHVDLKDIAARCDMSQGQAIDALMHYGRDRVLKTHEKVQKEPTQ